MTIKYIDKQDKNPLCQDRTIVHTSQLKKPVMIIQMPKNISLSKLSSHKICCKSCGMISSRLYNFIENQLSEALNMLQMSQICWRSLKLPDIKIQKEGNIKIEIESLEPQNKKIKQKDLDLAKKVSQILRNLRKHVKEPQNQFIFEQYSQNSKIFSEQQSLTQQDNLSNEYTQQILKHMKCLTVNSLDEVTSQHSGLNNILQTIELPNEFENNIFGLKIQYNQY